MMHILPPLMTHARFNLITAPPCAALASLRSLLSTGGDKTLGATLVLRGREMRLFDDERAVVFVIYLI